MRSEGFTLLEVIVATAILGMAILAIIQAFSLGLQGLSVDKEYATAISYAVLVTETLFLNLPEDGLRKSEHGYRWRWKVEDIENIEKDGKKATLGKDRQPEQCLRLFSCEVLWNSATKTRSLQIKSLGCFPNS